MVKIAIVTGASYGLGKAISRKLLSLNFKVYGISRTSPLIKNSQFIWLKADLTNPSSLNSIPALIKEKNIGLLVNNAGTAFEKKALDLTDDDFEKMFNLNFKVPIKLTNILFSKLSNGLVINISSVSDRYPDPLYGLYGSSKAALNIYFETIAEENKNIKVVNVLPNYINTPLQHKVSDSHKDFDWKMTMQPDQVAEIIPYIIANTTKIESGSRIIVVSKSTGDYSKNPEKLWIYTVDDKKMKKIN
jgi:hypothetical protein